MVIGPGEEANLVERASTARDQCRELAQAIINDHPLEDIGLNAQHFDWAVRSLDAGLERGDPEQLGLKHECEAIRNWVNDPDIWYPGARAERRRMLRGLQEFTHAVQEFIDQQTAKRPPQ